VKVKIDGAGERFLSLEVQTIAVTVASYTLRSDNC